MKTMEEKIKKQIVSAVATVLTEWFAAHPSREDELEKALSFAELENGKLQNRLTEMNSKYEDLQKELEELKSHNQAQDKSDTKPSLPAPSRKGKDEGLIKHEKFDDILWCVKENEPVMLVGPAGTGKNVIAEQVANELGLDFYMLSKISEDYQVKGFVNANGEYETTPFVNAFTKGGVLFSDEIDACNENALMTMQTATANGYIDLPKMGMVHAHPDFRIIAAANTAGNGADETYTSRNVLDAATLDRYAYKGIEYDKRIELKCAGGDKELVEFARDLRKAYEKCNYTRGIISYRGISKFKKFESRFGIDEALKMSIIKGMSDDDREMIGRQLTCYNKYALAFKKSAKRVAA